MRSTLISAVISALMLSTNVLAGVLNDSDIPMMKDALKKSYTLELCQKDLPGATQATCTCLGEAMAKNLNTEKLLQCNKDGYDDCVAAEFSASKSSLTETQINDCKALAKSDASTTTADAPASTTESKKADSEKSE